MDIEHMIKERMEWSTSEITAMLLFLKKSWKMEYKMSCTTTTITVYRRIGN